MSNMKNKLKIISRKKWMKFSAAALCLCLVFGGIRLSSAQAQDASITSDYTVLHRADLTHSINVKGVVESELSRRVHSNLTYNVENVFVKVGDYVTEGTPLAQLDIADLKLKIAQSKEDLSASEKNNLNQLQNAQRLLSEASSNLNSGANAQILSAESALKTAEIELQNAKKAYEDALNDNAIGINSKVSAAESSLETAKLELDRKQTVFDNNKALFDVGALSREELNQSETDLTNAKVQYNDALLNLENAKTADSRALELTEENLQTATANYENAIKALDATKISAQQDISNYINNIQSAQIAVDNHSNVLAVTELEKQLSDSTIRSPIDGTVTAVYAKEGNSGQGILFVVEDTAKLKIQTRIKEYDVGNLKAGMKVLIKSDATGSIEYEGMLSKIEPAAVKSNSGEVTKSSNVEFQAEVTVASGDTDLKIGMNTRMNIILDSRNDIYYVPYDAVKKNSEGQATVYLLEDTGRIREVTVSTGLETDFYIEIEGNGIQDGVKVLNDASGLEDGMKLS